MNRRFSFFLIVEGIILFFLLAALFRRGFILLLALAIFLTWMNGRLNMPILKVVTGVIWIIAIFQILSSGAFWLAIIFPIVIAFSYHRKKEQSENGNDSWSWQSNSQAQQTLAEDDENEIIDLSEVHYHTGGNTLSVKKSSGNVKIIVPEDVGIALSIQVSRGLVKIFNEQTEINNVSLRYFSKDYQSLEKRISIRIVVDNGNVEVLHQL